MTDQVIHPSADPAVRPQSDIDLGRFNRNPAGKEPRVPLAFVTRR